MKKISSRALYINKRVFPVFWFGVLALVLSAMLFGAPKQEIPVVAYIVPVAMGVFGYFIMSKLVFDLADEVFDAGDALIVRRGDIEERIPLAEIINVSWTLMVNPARVTLTLRNPGRLGKNVSFSPQRKVFQLTTSPLIEDLIERVDAARLAAGKSPFRGV